MQKPLFSILICTVGKPELTKIAVQSILNQSFRDFEIVVTDTSATKNISDIVACFKDPRVVFFEVPGRDPSAGWDFAYTKSSGEYILWYDDDNSLVPWALERYKKNIEETGADIVSGNHVYYYGPGNRHDPQHDNTLSVLFPFSLQRKTYRPEDVIAAFYDFSAGKEKMPPRWHSAATFVSRAVCEEVRRRTGNVITPGLRGNFHFHPLLFAYAQKPVYDDRPLCVIGKFASSETQQWSMASTQERKTKTFARPYRLTGLSARTLWNTAAECYLRAQELIPEKLGHYKVNLEKLFKTYLEELVLIELPLLKHFFHWKEFWLAAAKLPSWKKEALRRQIIKGFIESLVIRLARFLKIWNLLRKIARRRVAQNPLRKLVDLKKYQIFSILECAAKLDLIMSREFNLKIRE